eukprot:jgi/Mesen1/10815/ME000093S10332
MAKVMNNYKNVPSSLYGLNPMQIDMFNTEDSPMKRQAGLVTAESITSLRNYQEGTGLWSARDIQGSSNANVSMAVSMYRGGGAAGRPRSAPPDLPSLLLDARICYLGMPIVPAVTELIIAQLLFLQYDDPRKPIYFYINSPGTQLPSALLATQEGGKLRRAHGRNEQRESVGFETEAYAIADTFDSQRKKSTCPQSPAEQDQGTAPSTPKVYAPRVGNSSGSAIDMYVKQKELDANTRYYIELLSLGTGKSEAVIAKDISRTAYYRGQEAIDYGLADKIIEARGVQMDKKNYDSMLAESKMASRNPSNPSRVYRPGGAPAPVPAGGGRK